MIALINGQPSSPRDTPSTSSRGASLIVIAQLLVILCGMGILTTADATIALHTAFVPSLLAMWVVVDMAYAARLSFRHPSARAGFIIMQCATGGLCSLALALGMMWVLAPLSISILAGTLICTPSARLAFVRTTLPTERARSVDRRRQRNIFEGYAMPALDAPRPTQLIGYHVTPPGFAEPVSEWALTAASKVSSR